MADCHYLLVYDLAARRLIESVDLGSDSAAAVVAYQEHEAAHEDRKDIEIVLVAADSIETVRQTHRSYFEGEVSRVREAYLADF